MRLGSAQVPAHDAFTRLLTRLEPDPDREWEEAEPLVEKPHGILVIDDSGLGKPYAGKNDLVTRHRSGKHKKPVRGINLIMLLWTDGLSKHDHFWEVRLLARARGFAPKCVRFDGWYASLENPGL